MFQPNSNRVAIDVDDDEFQNLTCPFASKDTWALSEFCQGACQKKFHIKSQLRRRHHCRNCGQSVCSNCSSKLPLLEYGIKERVPVCNTCAQNIENANKEMIIKKADLDQKRIEKKKQEQLEQELKEAKERQFKDDSALCIAGDMVIKIPSTQLPIGLHHTLCKLTLIQAEKLAVYENGELLEILLPDGTPKIATVAYRNPDNTYSLYYTEHNGTQSSMNAPAPMVYTWAVQWQPQVKEKEKKADNKKKTMDTKKASTKKEKKVSSLVLEECKLIEGINHATLSKKEKRAE